MTSFAVEQWFGTPDRVTGGHLAGTLRLAWGRRERGETGGIINADLAEVSRGIGLVEETSLRDARGKPEALVRVCTEDPPSQEYGIGHRADTETAQFRRLKCGPRSSLVQPKSRRPRTLLIVPIHYRYKFNVSIRIITKFVNKY